MYREVMTVYTDILTQRKTTLCEQNVEFVNVQPGGMEVTTGS
jgi:hypothetical protein